MTTTIVTTTISRLFIFGLAILFFPAGLARGQTAAAQSPATEPASPQILPGRGAAEYPFLYAGEYDVRRDVQTIYIVRDGKIAWSYQIPTKNSAGDEQELSDATMLSNGNVVFARKTGAGEVTPDKKLIWNVDAPKGCEIHIAQPIGLDKVMYIQNGNPARLFIVSTATGKTDKELVLPTAHPEKTHPQFRRVRITKAGTILAAHMDSDKVVEYDMDGKVIWSVNVASPWAANRLDNGNTLISSNRGFVREVSPSGATVWEFTPADLPGIQIFNIQEADRLANGNTLITNWCPVGLKDTTLWPTSVQAFEISPDKTLVWALRSWENPDLGPATNIQLLDEPGAAENQDQHR